MQVRIQNDDTLSEPFTITNGVKQGCFLVSTLSTYGAILKDALMHKDLGRKFGYPKDVQLFLFDHVLTLAKKMAVMYPSAPKMSYTEPVITTCNSRLNPDDKLKYEQTSAPFQHWLWLQK